MKVTLCGDPGSGKSVIGKAISEKLELKQYSGGYLMRNVAIKRGITLSELMEQNKKDPSADYEVDKEIIALGKNENNFIMDSRTAFHFIPDAIKIFLKTDPKKAAERIWRDIQENKRSTEKQFKSLEEVYQSIIARQSSESERYKKYYNINHLDMNNYDIVIDATNMTVQEEVDAVLTAIDKLTNKKAL
jgi:cytidylate kinase